MNTIQTITPEELRGAVPGYVARAHQLGIAVFERAITQPAAGLAVRATIYDAAAPRYEKHVADPERLAELWAAKERIKALEVDVPMGAGRLALEATMGLRDLRVWTYKPPEDIEAGRARRRRRVTWPVSGARDYLGYLTAPGYTFDKSTEVDQELGFGPALLTYVYAPQDALAGRHRYHGAVGIGNATADVFTGAIRPICTEADRALLEGHGTATYHTHKIGQLLALLGSVT
ncbi:MAG TPA: hypothetical protein VLE99_02975 [Candidatus Saccharimonadales bacterium]|nr:hypothetical protein [Candidatus Saccharimonadales bacterium]